MIDVKNIHKQFDRQAILNGVSLSVKKGSIYGLLGSNGAGKTTLLNTISGVYRQDKGNVFIDQQPVFENLEIKEKMVFIPDTLYFFPQYTIDQTASFYKNMYSGWNEERYVALREVFGIDTSKKIHKLSKGMQRQVSFWLSLSAMPDILILDEPFDGLDPVMRKKIKNLLVQDVAEREMTIMISSHNLREVEDLCDHIGILHKGNLLLEKDIDDLKSDVHKVQLAFKHDTPSSLFSSMQLLYKEERGSVTLAIVRGDYDEVTAHFQNYDPVIYDILPLTLEEIFIYEMGDAGYAIKNILV
ncbi:ABC transporter ATP-binding protein [Fictibacillus aquaticus]|uniref:ABC transporter n=1 Tax=Fictibacillus aquaticus TaxID=2021314 RepID=A0A235FF10_9BACL|nr:ABC transporter ATP-binding protein [Fictibacillus aquaticus]OYD59534.1 ABC transporter [Fictibacillus aquaticus]